MIEMRRAPLKIVHLVLSLEVGGLEVLVSKIASRQVEQGAVVHILCLDALGGLANELSAKGIQITLLARKSGKIDISTVKKIRRYLKQHNISLLHTHNFEPYLYGILSTAFRPTALVHSQHGLVQDLSFAKKIFAQVSLLFKPVLAAVSTSVSEHMQAMGWWHAKTSRVAVNGVDTHLFLPNDKFKLSVRKKIGLAEQDFILICVARLAAIKDHKTLIRVFSTVAKKRHNTKLLLVGDGPLKTALMQFAKEELGDNLDRLLFFGERSNIIELLQASDVFMLTSLSEGISISLLEGMSTGLVPVVTAVGGNVEIIQSQVNGLLFEKENDQQGSALLNALQENLPAQSDMSKQARQTVIDRFSFAQMMDSYDSLYHLALRNS